MDQHVSNSCDTRCVILQGHEVQMRPDGYWWRPTWLDQYVKIGELRKHAREFLATQEKQQAKHRADKLKRLKAKEEAIRKAAEPVREPYPKKPYYWARARAKRMGVAIMSPEQYAELCKRAAGRCEVSGIPFSDEREPGCLRKPWAPSIDRIDSSKDYHASNCRLVCGAVNFAMNEYGVSVLLRMARAVVIKHGSDPAG